MKLVDYHVHTSHSPDSKASMEEYFRQARSKGLDHVVFTDHVDFGGPDLFTENRIDYEEYFSVAERLAKKYELEVRIGVEIGYEQSCQRETEEFLVEHPFDFVIASIHSINGRGVDERSFFRNRTKKEAYGRYFEAVHEMIKSFNDYDVLGHLDYIVRYGPFRDRSYDYREFKTEIDALLRDLIGKGRGIELNTSGLRNDLATTFPQRDVLQRYRELGGTIVTLGSDCHENKDYCAGFPGAVQLLRTLEFREISYFKGRKRERRPL